jgi:hypothetical protein
MGKIMGKNSVSDRNSPRRRNNINKFFGHENSDKCPFIFEIKFV